MWKPLAFVHKRMLANAGVGPLERAISIVGSYVFLLGTIVGSVLAFGLWIREQESAAGVAIVSGFSAFMLVMQFWSYGDSPSPPTMQARPASSVAGACRRLRERVNIPSAVGGASIGRCASSNLAMLSMTFGSPFSRVRRLTSRRHQVSYTLNA